MGISKRKAQNVPKPNPVVEVSVKNVSFLIVSDCSAIFNLMKLNICSLYTFCKLHRFYNKVLSVNAFSQHAFSLWWGLFFIPQLTMENQAQFKRVVVKVMDFGF